MNYNNSLNENRDLLIAALNKNQVAFAQIAKIAETVSSGTLKLRLNETGKSVIMEYLNKKITIDLNRLKIDGVKYLNDLLVDDIAVKDDINYLNEMITRIEQELTNKADKEHEHVLADIVDYKPYDDSELREMINTKPTITSYSTMDDMIKDWNNIPDNSIAVTAQGADQWSATFTYKWGKWRALNLTIPKDEKDYLWTRFIGSANTPWEKDSGWRKIPVLTKENVLVCNNVKADNNERLTLTEEGIKTLNEIKADIEHVHYLNEIVDYKPYDDSEVRGLINNCLTKNDEQHELPNVNKTVDVKSELYFGVDGLISCEHVDNGVDNEIIITWSDESVSGSISYIKIDDESLDKEVDFDMNTLSEENEYFSVKGPHQLIVNNAFKNKIEFRVTANTSDKQSVVDYTITKTSGYDITPIKNKVPSIKYVHDYIAQTINNLEDVDEQIFAALGNYSTLGHKHTISDVEDYKPYDDSEVRELVNKRLQFTSYSTLADVKTDWNNIPNYSLIFTHDGPEQYMNTLIIRGESQHRSLILGMPKVEKNYTWIKFQGYDSTPWKEESAWRKIPVLDTSSNIVCNNVKADNETRLKAVENNKADKTHTHSISEIIEYEPYDDSVLRELVATKADAEHTHTIAEIVDYEPYDDSVLKDWVISKADKNHTHNISDITNLQSSLNSKLNTSEFNKINQHIKTYKMRSDYRRNNAGDGKEIVYQTLCYVKNNFTTYKGFMAKFELNVAATNNGEQTVFESSEVFIGHVMEWDNGKTPIGISSCYRKIGLTDRSLGIGLVDVNGDNTVYRIDLLVYHHHSNYYRLNFNVICEVDTKIMLYSNAECSTELSITGASIDSSFTSLSDYSSYQSYALSDTPHAPKVHTHTLTDITDYEPYDDTEVRSLIDTKSDIGHTHTISEITDYEDRIYNGPVKKTNVVYNITYKGSLNDKKGGEVSIDETLNTPIITFAKTNIPSLVNVYKDGLIIASIANYTVSGPNASWFYVIDKFTIQYTRDDENYDDTLIFKSTTSSGNFEDSYNISKSTQTTYTTKWNDNRYIPTTSYIRDWLYPVGSIYTSMNDVDPAHLFGGTWTQITDRFLYCANSSKQTGGNKKINIDQLPWHQHEILNKYDDFNYNHGVSSNDVSITTNSIPNDVGSGQGSYTRTTMTQGTGANADYMPPYITIYAWYRTA